MSHSSPSEFKKKLSSDTLSIMRIDYQVSTLLMEIDYRVSALSDKISIIEFKLVKLKEVNSDLLVENEALKATLNDQEKDIQRQKDVISELKRNILVLSSQNNEYTQAKVEADKKINALTVNVAQLELENKLLQDKIEELLEKTNPLSKQLDYESEGIVKLNKKYQKLESELEEHKEEHKFTLDKLNDMFSTEIHHLKNQLCFLQNKALTHESSDQLLKLGEVQRKIHDYLAILTARAALEEKVLTPGWRWSDLSFV